MQFHIARAVRESLDLDDLLFSYTGNVVFANVQASRKLAAKMTEARTAVADPAAIDDPSGMVNAGALFAMGLIDELAHALVARYRKEVDPAVLTEAVRWFASQAGAPAVDKLLLRFTEQFPNTDVYSGKTSAEQWLAGTSEDQPNREAALEELLLLWLANKNPAFQPFRELFEDTGLKQGTAYAEVTATLPEYFSTRPPLSAQAGSLIDALQAPFLASPDSLTGQLDFIRENWTPYLGAELKRVMLAISTLREEDIAIWMRFNPAGPDKYRHGAPGFGGEGFVGDEYVGFDEQYEWVTAADGTRTRVRKYDRDYQAPLNEYEAFSADQAWMPNVVLMAKSTYVWLEQLSKKYSRHIHKLEHIPDEELRLLADRGITGLWLIGLWERSVASRTIKRLRGQSDAVASAYSLKEYDIAEDLGGNSGYESLRDRAGRFGLRLASDMVPNHMGIDSSWVIDHPDWFISRPESPFPVYSFEGPDLSTDSRVEIKLEDHYFDQTDAAVVFRLRHHGDGATRFMYHGNDGTTFAWNDTAQLDYSKAAVREHVTQVILQVARLFPIIRFDAAMVLAKRHVQRLWFPLPGAGGSIPSRAENAMSQEEFDAIMPLEFWREVVDRVAVEVPGTLLLAEAFWMLEGYFVRTLGMHRVYNSAFMNMLRDEENAKYRSYLKKTLEFDPDILKRYVNFMSNPDERTTIDQFGSGDKCFGVATLMSTLPGLPMFGHGQIEGYTERYGMEYKQAKMNEWPDEGLVARHQHEIAPLLKNRRIFAESASFRMYDFWNEHGSVDENVFAYSNMFEGQRSLIVYNNTYGSTRGTLHRSVGQMDKGSGELRQTSLSEALALPGDHSLVVAYREKTSGLEYLRRASDFAERGLFFELRGYQYAVLLHWRELRSTAEQPWDQLCDALNGAGVYSVDEALSKLRLRPIHEALRQTITRTHIAAFAEVGETVKSAASKSAAAELDPKLHAFIAAGERFYDSAHALFAADFEAAPVAAVAVSGDAAHNQLVETVAHHEHKALKKAPANPTPQPARAPSFREGLQQLAAQVSRLPSMERGFSQAWPEAVRSILPSNEPGVRAEQTWAPALAWLLVRSLNVAGPRTEFFDKLQLRSALAETFSSLGLEGEGAWRAAAQVRVLLAAEETKADAAAFWKDADARWLAGVTEHEGETYFNKERFEELLCWLQLPKLAAGESAEPAVTAACTASQAAGYDLAKYLSLQAKPLLSEKPLGGSKTVPATESNAKVAQASPSAGPTKPIKATRKKAPSKKA